MVDWQAHIRDVNRSAIAADVPLISDAVRGKISWKRTSCSAELQFRL